MRADTGGVDVDRSPRDEVALGSRTQGGTLQGPEQGQTPGGPAQKHNLVLVQIDGLSHQALTTAMKAGIVPNLQALMDARGFALSRYHCGVAPITMAVQASILYGVELPGNEWFDKSTERYMSGVGYEPTLKQDLASQGRCGLLKEGSAFSTHLNGDAADSYFAFGKFREDLKTKGRVRTIVREAVRDAAMLAKGRFGLTRTAFAFVRDLFRARARMKKDGVLNTPEDRDAAIMNPVLKHLASSVAEEGIKEAVEHKVPIMYADFATYDDESHYFGPLSTDAMGALKLIDARVGHLVEKIENSPEKYDLVLFSDHGHTPVRHFVDLYGQTVEDTVASLAETSAQVAGRAFDRTRDIICTPVGSLGNLYFNFKKEGASLGEIESHYPGLLDRVSQTPGIGVVCGRESDTFVIKGKDGALYVAVDPNGKTTPGSPYPPLTVRQVGANPLAPYGEEDLLVSQVVNYMQIKNSDDVILFGEYDAAHDTAVDLGSGNSVRSSHGGIGGEQTRPFILCDPALGINGTTITEATQLHDALDRLAHPHPLIQSPTAREEHSTP